MATRGCGSPTATSPSSPGRSDTRSPTTLPPHPRSRSVDNASTSSRDTRTPRRPTARSPPAPTAMACPGDDPAARRPRTARRRGRPPARPAPTPGGCARRSPDQSGAEPAHHRDRPRSTRPGRHPAPAAGPRTRPGVTGMVRQTGGDPPRLVPGADRPPPATALAPVIARATPPTDPTPPPLPPPRPHRRHDHTPALVETTRSTTVFSTPGKPAHNLALRTPFSRRLQF